MKSLLWGPWEGFNVTHYGISLPTKGCGKALGCYAIQSLRKSLSDLVHEGPKPSFSTGGCGTASSLTDLGTGFGTGMEGLVYSFSRWNSPEVASLPYQLSGLKSICLSSLGTTKSTVIFQSWRLSHRPRISYFTHLSLQALLSILSLFGMILHIPFPVDL